MFMWTTKTYQLSDAKVEQSLAGCVSFCKFVVLRLRFVSFDGSLGITSEK